MTLAWLIDDETIEALVLGEPVEPGLDRLVAFARDARSLADQPPPPASPNLMALLATGDTAAPLATPPLTTVRSVTLGRSRRFTPAAAKAAGLSLAAKIALGASVAAAGTVGAGAVGALPSDANSWVRQAIEAVTPVEFDEPATTSRDDNFGSRVSGDATGETDGEPGVDGPDTADDAPGASRRPTDPGAPADAPATSRAPDTPQGGGLDRAQDTPASPRLPNDLPAGDGQSQSPPTSTPPTSTPPQAPKSGTDTGTAGTQRSATGGGDAADSPSEPAPAGERGPAATNAQPTNPAGP